MSSRPKPVTTTSLRVGLAVAVGVLQEEDVRRVGDPDAAVADGDAGGDVQPLGEDRELVGLAVAVGVFENLDAVAARARLAARIFEAFGDPDPAALVEGHGHRIDDVRLAATSSTVNPGGTVILAIASAGDSGGPGGLFCRRGNTSSSARATRARRQANSESETVRSQKECTANHLPNGYSRTFRPPRRAAKASIMKAGFVRRKNAAKSAGANRVEFASISNTY